MLKKINWSSALSSIVMMIVGVLIIIYPEVTSDVAAMILGIGAIVFGAFNLLSYFMSKPDQILHSNQFMIGFLVALFGIFILYKRDLIVDLIPVILGFIIVMSGIYKLQTGIVAKKIGYGNASVYMILAIISIALGIVIMFFLNGDQMKNFLFILIGVSLVYSGASDLFANAFLAAKFNAFVKNFEKKVKDSEKNVVDAEAVEVSSEDVSEDQDSAKQG